MSENQILKAAQWYAKQGYSVIPILPPKADSKGKDEQKKPPIAWLPYQTQKATEDEIKQWFTDKPDMRLAIVTGAISNLTIFDCDTPEAIEQIESILPDNFRVPIATSPRGGRHYYFQHEAQIPNKAGVAAGIDTRSEGGYIIAPPSGGLNGKGYFWLEGCKISDIDIPLIDSSLLSYILSFFLKTRASASSVPSAINMFEEGRRDNDLFHTASCLVKGGMPDLEIKQVLEKLIISWGEAPDQKWINAKIESALKRSESKTQNLAEEVKEWVQLSTAVHFLSTDVHKELNLWTRQDKKNVAMILARLSEETPPLIEKYGEKRGSWRTIDKTINEQRWWDDTGEPLLLRFPLGVDQHARIFEGNVILLEGQKSAGKTAFALEFCRLNTHLFHGKALYQNVEMNDSELRQRFESYGDVYSLDQWRENVMIIRNTGSWWDKIQPNGLNVIDYLVEYENPFMKAKFIMQIHDKLKKGIALILNQRDPRKPYGHGGISMRDIPRLIISLMGHRLKLEDVKSFTSLMGRNPTGLVRKYKQANWWKFIPDSDWDWGEEEKYEDFEK